MTVVCDTSPLLVLAKVGRLELLTTLYEAVWVPSSVVDEITAQQQADTEAIEQWRDAHDSVFQASNPDVQEIPDELGAGERAAIALAIEKNTNLVVLDDQKGRRVARARGLEVTGTVGVNDWRARGGPGTWTHLFILPRTRSRCRGWVVDQRINVRPAHTGI